MVAVPLIFGRLVADDYEDNVASDTRIDELRAKMVVEVDERYTREYLESDTRSIANAVQVIFKDGSKTQKIEVEYPIGHKRRRKEGIPVLEAKFRANLATRFSPKQCARILGAFENDKNLLNMNFNEFSDLFVL